VESDSTAAFLKDLKVLPVTAADSTGTIYTTLPTQSSISTKEYPMISPIVLVNCGMEKKSGTNFVNFLFKTKAQRLILKCGLSPAIFPGREVIIKP
jgi:ABC-type phosphate transport system substrate-binding protein